MLTWQNSPVAFSAMKGLQTPVEPGLRHPQEAASGDGAVPG